ncbi:MAG: TrkH family potassium uptake protein [Trueperaceae bacterium]|nr:TrkH family potassium uptake protein [Trueperaceae bacterium]
MLGALILLLPFMHKGTPFSFLDALFTATSALCVTGLAVVDTGTAFTRWGQLAIMIFFQIGGLGILTLGVFLALASGRKVGFSERMRLQMQINALQVGGVVRLLRTLLLTVFIAEASGAALLYVRFAKLEGPFEGMFYAIFHSISAFNNAGFALYSDSLMQFVADPLVNFTVIALILVGGLGFFVVADLSSRFSRARRAPLSLHTKLVVFSSLVLLLFGFMFFLIVEWNNPATLHEKSLGTKLLASLFQAVTPRTAGFNTVDYNSMELPTLLVSILLMFIGANPGSTGGGIKTVTVFVIVGSAWSIIRGQGELKLFGRRVATPTVMRAGVIALTGAILVGAALTLLTLTDANLPFRDLFFEAVSAFATVGLSVGITAELSASGKVIIIVLMYLGRVGLLTAALALVSEDRSDSIRYPAEEVIIG